VKGKDVPIRSQAPCHGNILGSGGIAPRILWRLH